MKNNHIRRLFNYWLYYGLGRNEYKISMETGVIKNISSLRWVNMVVAILMASFAFHPLFIEKYYIKAWFFIGSTIIAIILYVISSIKKRQIKKGKTINISLIYTLIILYFANVITFGIYLAVWENLEKIAGSFLGILICVLFLFNISPLLYLGLTASTVAIFIVFVIQYKIPSVWSYDIQNSILAGAIAIIFGWQIVMNRLTNISNTRKLEEERNDYFSQSTIDDLTQLKNRRDFMRTFAEYYSDDQKSNQYLCIALMDIDSFKNYNDHYGHLKGDECLRTIGKTLIDFQEKNDIYAARVDGEKFALLWYEKYTENAYLVSSKINKLITDLNIPHESSKIAPYITVSIGLHVWKCGTPLSMQTLFGLADKALFLAKNKGQNQTVVSS